MCTVIGQFLGPYILLFGPLKCKAVLLPYFSLIYRQTFLTFIASKSLFNFLLLSYSVLKHANYLAAISNWLVLLSIYVRNLKPFLMNRTCQTHCRQGLNNNYLNFHLHLRAINASGDLRRNLNYTLLFINVLFMYKRKLQPTPGWFIIDLRRKK